MANSIVYNQDNKMSFSQWYNRVNPTPIDASSIFTTMAAAEAYAASSPIAYPGQIVSVVTETEVKVYKINNHALEEVGSRNAVVSNYSELMSQATNGNIGSVVYLSSPISEVPAVKYTQEEIDAAQEGDDAFGKTTEDVKTPGNSPYDAGAYIVTGNGTVQKLAESAATGNYGSDITALQGDVSGIKTQIGDDDSGLVKAINDNASAIEGKADASLVTTLVGSDTDKSIREIAAEELAAQLIPESAQESLNTLEEIAAWIQAHPEDAAAMNSDISALQSTIGVASKPAEYYSTYAEYVADYEAKGWGVMAKDEFDELPADSTEKVKIGTGTTASGLIARIESLESSADGVDAAITSKIGALDSEKSGSSNGISVTVKEVDGLIDTVSVTAPDFASTYEAKGAAETVKTAIIGSASDVWSDEEGSEVHTLYAIKNLVANISDETSVTSGEASAIVVDNSVANTFDLSLKLAEGENAGNVVLTQSANGLKGELSWSQYDN